LLGGSGVGWRVMWCVGSSVVREWCCFENCDAKTCWTGNVCLTKTFWVDS
jgi:hypothetical protein